MDPELLPGSGTRKIQSWIRIGINYSGCATLSKTVQYGTVPMRTNFGKTVQYGTVPMRTNFGKNPENYPSGKIFI